MWDRYDPRDHGRDRSESWDRSFGSRGSSSERDRNEERDPRDVFTKDLDLPRGRERRPVRERDRVYELDGAESRALATIGVFRVEWTTQQFRSVLTGDEPYRFVVHDRDAVFAAAVDDTLRSMHLRVLKTPACVPQANAFCERLIGTARRECLDHFIPLNERHRRKIVAEWVLHYNRGRPHASLGPGIPEPVGLTVSRAVDHQLPHGHQIVATPILAGLHHEYRLEPIAA
ncbi:MAG TPA: integrase core domain-containing protein [Vicinamibacterales bacterium]|nr:integrase core domain-containing protein [Vicinamibacterales bacterium]